MDELSFYLPFVFAYVFLVKPLSDLLGKFISGFDLWEGFKKQESSFLLRKSPVFLSFEKKVPAAGKHFDGGFTIDQPGSLFIFPSFFFGCRQFSNFFLF